MFKSKVTKPKIYVIFNWSSVRWMTLLSSIFISGEKKFDHKLPIVSLIKRIRKCPPVPWDNYFSRYTSLSSARFSGVLFAQWSGLLLNDTRYQVHGRAQFWLNDRGIHPQRILPTYTVVPTALFCSTSFRRQWFSTTGAASLWDRTCETYGRCASGPSADCRNNNQYRCHNCSCGKRVAWNSTRQSSKNWTNADEGRRSTSWQTTRSTVLFAERVTKHSMWSARVCMIYSFVSNIMIIWTVCHYMQLCNSNTYISRSQWPRGLRRRSAAARLLRSWVRIPPGA